MKRPLIAAAAAFALAGCATTGAGGGVSDDTKAVAAQLIVKVAAMKYIEQAGPEFRAGRAARVIQVASTVADTARGGELELQSLVALAAAQLPENLEPSDRMLAMALISVAEAELKARTGVGGLQSDTLLKLAEVLDWISDAATLYAPTS